jgi:hypothetical protein
MVIKTAMDYKSNGFLLDFCNTVYIVFTSAASNNRIICQVRMYKRIVQTF